MEEKPKLKVNPPQLPCDECINNEGKLFKNEVAVCYCSHVQAMGVYHIRTKKWEVWSPVSAEEYQRAVQKAKNRIDILDSPSAWWNAN